MFFFLNILHISLKFILFYYKIMSINITDFYNIVKYFNYFSNIYITYAVAIFGFHSTIIKEKFFNLIQNIFIKYVNYILLCQ
jgi:hypothetical protein